LFLYFRIFPITGSVFSSFSISVISLRPIIVPNVFRCCSHESRFSSCNSVNEGDGGGTHTCIRLCVERT
jgi:hypothetical protein